MKDQTKEKLLKQKAEIEKKLEELEKQEKKGFVIKNRYNSSDVYVSQADNLRDAVIEAVENRADLGEADLGEANLWGADLRGANLRGAGLRGADLGEARFYGKGGTKKLKKNQVEDFLKALGFIIED